MSWFSKRQSCLPNNISPLAAQNIERQQFIVPDIISCVAQAGYLGASIPQKYGGRGYDSYQLCALHEVMAGVHGSLENLITVTGMVSTLLQRVGSAAQKPIICQSWQRGN